VNGKGSGLAVLYRSDLLTPRLNLGTHQIDKLGNGYLLRFGGVLLETLDHLHSVGVFTGKIGWGNPCNNPPGDCLLDPVTNEPRELTQDDRAREATDLLNWIQQVMEPFPNSTRVITTDMNSRDCENAPTEPSCPVAYTSPAWTAFNTQFDPGKHDSGLSTVPDGTRLDYIWWDWDGGAKAASGYVDGPRRSMDFGSDHRFVWAKLRFK
jgi:hypothetical protein